MLCVNTCPNGIDGTQSGQYLSTNKSMNSYICLLCQTSCLQCVEILTCDKCYNSLVLLPGKISCTFNCPTGDNSNNKIGTYQSAVLSYGTPVCAYCLSFCRLC